MNRHVWIISVLLLILAGPAVGYEIGDTVADFTLPDLQGGEASLYDHMGEIILLNFFTTWCPGCNEEAIHLENDIKAAYAEENGVTVIALDLQEPAPLVEGWVAAQNVTYHVWLAPDWDLFAEFPNTLAIPYSAILDREMKIRYGSSGFDLAALTGAIDAVLAENQVPVSQSSWGGVKALFQ